MPVHTAFAMSLGPAVPGSTLASWCLLATRALVALPGGPPPAAAQHAAPDAALKAARQGAGALAGRAAAAVRLLRGAADPADFVARWNHLDAAVPSRHATRLRLDGTHAVWLQHGGRTGGALAHSRLVVAGTVCACLAQLGLHTVCQGWVFDAGGFPSAAGGAPRPAPAGSPGSFAIEIVHHGAQAARPADPFPIPEDVPALAPLLRALTLEPGQAPALAAAAAAAGLSPRRLQRLLATAGVTWPQVVRAARLQAAAARMLGEPRTSLTRIAHELGFADSAHFARGFRAAAGLTPSAYRNIARGRAP
ncbi:MAG: AraC family transcriptional regulator [Proteobacteria bacterium]|nr:AraC family transcriptional regulator [Pseudomonadota bacterium]